MEIERRVRREDGIRKKLKDTKGLGNEETGKNEEGGRVWVV